MTAALQGVVAPDGDRLLVSCLAGDGIDGGLFVHDGLTVQRIDDLPTAGLACDGSRVFRCLDSSCQDPDSRASRLASVLVLDRATWRREVPLGDAAGAAAAIGKLAGDAGLRAEHGERLRCRVRGCFDPATCAGRYVGLFETLLGWNRRDR